MTTSNEQSNEKMYSEKELAKRWGISERTLQFWRYKKTGPSFIRMGYKMVRYPESAVRAFENSGFVEIGKAS